MPYQVNIRSSAEDYLAGISAEVRERILEKVDGLKTEPRPIDSELVEQDSLEIRYVFAGDHQIVYQVMDAENTFNIVVVREHKGFIPEI